MEGYLGEKIVEQKDTPFEHYDKDDWEMYFIEQYGDIDGEHHKKWLLDQIVRIKKGTPIIIKIAEWENGDYEYRIDLDEPTDDYKEWVEEVEYLGHNHEIGIPP